MKRILLLWVLGLLAASCEEFVKIDPPRTELVSETVFASNASAEAAMIDLYYTLRSSRFASGNRYSVTYLTGLSSDEVLSYSFDAVNEFGQFNEATLRADNFIVENLWIDIYKTIYKANAIIVGVRSSGRLEEELKSRLEAEARFVRALAYFYLINLWGEVPLVLGTDYTVNDKIMKSSMDGVNTQIVADLTFGKSVLPADYSLSNGDRVRVNKFAAEALLARVYLFMKMWPEAAAEATGLIESSFFQLEPSLDDVFKTTSRESILQLWTDRRPNELTTFYADAFGGPLNGALSEGFVSGFEDGDQRLVNWVESITFGGQPLYRPLKYRSLSLPSEEYSVVLRLAEQYLIRAEARAQQEDLPGAEADLNAVRQRAGLSDLNGLTSTALLQAILLERRSELFTEWGHRWLDLKRTNSAEAILMPIKPDWRNVAELYPIPENQILTNNIGQNPGY